MVIAHQLILLFGLVLIGYFINKCGILDSTANDKISKLLVNVTIPSTIIHSAVSNKSETNGKIICVFIIAILFYLIVPAINQIIAKCLKQKAEYGLMLTYSNLGFMGIPIVKSIYGDQAVFYVTIFMIIFNISIFSSGVYALSKEQSLEWKNFINPGILSALVGMVLFLLHIPVQSDLSNLLGSIGSVTTPLAMLVIGSTLAEIPLKEVFTDISMYILSLIKLVIWPTLVYLILKLCIRDSVILGVSVLLASLPVAGNVSMICRDYGGNLETVTKGICISTLFSIISIPLWIYGVLPVNIVP